MGPFQPPRGTVRDQSPLAFRFERVDGETVTDADCGQGPELLYCKCDPQPAAKKTDGWSTGSGKQVVAAPAPVGVLYGQRVVDE